MSVKACRINFVDNSKRKYTCTICWTTSRHLSKIRNRCTNNTDFLYLCDRTVRVPQILWHFEYYLKAGPTCLISGCLRKQIGLCRVNLQSAFSVRWHWARYLKKNSLCLHSSIRSYWVAFHWRRLLNWFILQPTTVISTSQPSRKTGTDEDGW